MLGWNWVFSLARSALNGFSRTSKTMARKIFWPSGETRKVSCWEALPAEAVTTTSKKPGS